MLILQTNIAYMWASVIIPREGDVYVYGGSLNLGAVNQGTDCSGAVSEVNEALLYGSQMNWLRQFWTGTFAGAQPGDTGPFGGVDCTAAWVCIASPTAAPPGTVMIVAVNQDPDPQNAHMVCQVLDPTNLTGFGGPGKYVGIESGGRYTDAQGNSTLHIGPEATPVTDGQFGQWFAVGALAPAPTPTPTPPRSTMLQGLDYAGGRISGADVLAAGYQFVCRYLYDGAPQLPYKLLTAVRGGRPQRSRCGDRVQLGESRQ